MAGCVCRSGFGNGSAALPPKLHIYGREKETKIFVYGKEGTGCGCDELVQITAHNRITLEFQNSYEKNG